MSAQDQYPRLWPSDEMVRSVMTHLGTRTHFHTHNSNNDPADIIYYDTRDDANAALDEDAAAWAGLTRDGYNGTLGTHTPGTRDLDDLDAVALVSRDMYRSWQGIPDGKPMPRGYRTDAAEQLQGVIDEYNKWAQGECYGYQVQVHDPLCIDCMDPDDADPGPDCDRWNDTDDSCWGFIGYEYAEQEARWAGMAEAGIPIAQAA